MKDARRTFADGEITARGITMVQDGKEKTVEVRPEDIVLATLGLMVAGREAANCRYRQEERMKDAGHTWSGQELPIWMAQECPAAVNAETKFWRARACASLRD